MGCVRELWGDFFFIFSTIIKHKVVWMIAGHFLNADASRGYREEGGKGGSGAISGQQEDRGFLL